MQAEEIKREDMLLLPDEDFSLRHVCIVTGAATCFGRAMCMVSAANNLMTIGLDVDPEGGEKTQYLAREMGGQMIFIEADISSDQAVSYAVSEASKLGTIKYLVNIVCIHDVGSIETLEIGRYDSIQRLTLRASLCLSKLVIPHMRKSRNGRGVIGNMPALASPVSLLSNPLYRITVMALVALSQSISDEGGGKIRSFCLSTGFEKVTPSGKDYLLEAKSRGRGLAGTIDEEVRREEAISPVDMANLVIFGFSRFARHLKSFVYPFFPSYGFNLPEREHSTVTD